jgi:hypothetical protein
VTETAAATESTGWQARACAVLAVGAGVAEAESVAVWHVGSDGAPTGAWVVPCAEVLADAGSARRLLSSLEGRAITGASPDAVDAWLERLSAAAGPGDRGNWWKELVFSPVEAFREVVARRRAHEAAVTEERERNKSVTALVWRHDLPDDATVADFGELRTLAGIAPPDGTPVVSEALAVARVLSWLVALWAEAEDVKARRPYVRLQHGPLEPLPPGWSTAVRTAGTRS